MKKIQITSLMLLAIVAFSALFVASASAAPKLLLNGSAVTTLQLVSFNGEVEFEDMGVGAVVLCSAILDIDVETGGTLYFIDELLDLDGKLLAETVTVLGSPQETDMLECTGVKDCSTTPEATLVTAINLPWNADIELTEPPNRYHASILPNASGDEPGYVVDCNTLLGLIEDTCTNETTTGAVLTNETGGLLEEFNESTEADGCTVGGAKTGLLRGVEGVWPAGWTVSE